MRKKIICFILTLTIVMLTACGNTDADTQTNYLQDNDYYEIYVDKETGVNYVVYNNYHSNSGGMAIRLNADGTPYVSEVNND